MASFRAPSVEHVPADLRTFDPARWIQEALDADDPYLAPLAGRLTRAELFSNWYALRIIAPARYREALRAAVGERAGDHHFGTVL